MRITPDSVSSGAMMVRLLKEGAGCRGGEISFRPVV